MKKQIAPALYYLGILIILIFYSCVNEEMQLNTKTSVVTQLKNELKLEEFTNQNLAVNWDNIHKIEKENFQIYEIETNEINPTKIKSNLFQSDLKHELIAIKKGDDMFSYVIKAYTSLNHTLFPGSIQKLENFTGTVMVFDLNGKKLGELVIFNGTSKNVSGNNAIAPLNEAINLFASKKNLTSKTNDCYLYQIVNYNTTLYTDHYYYVTVGNYTSLHYSYTTSTTFTTSSTTAVPSPCGNKGQNYLLDEYYTRVTDQIDNQPDKDIAQIVIYSPTNVITNLKDYLRCFNLAIGATFTIYVDQPTANSSNSWSGTPNNPEVGHTFIAIQQGNDIRRVFGFYPRTNVNPVTSPSDPSAFGNDQGHTFDVSVVIPINASQLQTIINNSISASTSTYNLNTYNCTDFAIKMGNLAGLNLTDSYGTWPGGGGSNPGQLGQNIRSMALPANATRQTTSTNSAPNKGQCN